jgi:molybdenum cofactor cytidylyltransferase
MFSPTSPTLGSSFMPTVLVLASGRGERFAASGGQGNKLHAMLDGKRVIDWTLDTVRASGLPFHVEDAGHPGMGDSIAAAVQATPHAAGWLILPADLPLIRACSLLVVARELRRAPLVVPYFKGQRAHPVGLGPEHADVALRLSGPQGLARWIAAHEALNLAVQLELDDPGCVTDIDTVQDLHKAHALLASSVGA